MDELPASLQALALARALHQGMQQMHAWLDELLIQPDRDGLWTRLQELGQDLLVRAHGGVPAGSGPHQAEIAAAHAGMVQQIQALMEAAEAVMRARQAFWGPVGIEQLTPETFLSQVLRGKTPALVAFGATPQQHDRLRQWAAEEGLPLYLAPPEMEPFYSPGRSCKRFHQGQVEASIRIQDIAESLPTTPH